MPPLKKWPLYRASLMLGLALALGGCDLFGPADDGRAAFSTPPVDVPPPDGADLPDSVEARYREDAARLALRYLYEQDEEAADEQVELPEPLVTSLYNALARVYAARDLAARDSVVALYRIHTFPSPAMRSLIVAVDSTAGWVEAWRQGRRLTGQRRLDALMERYDLSLDQFYRWPWNHTAVLGTAEPLNLRALARLFDPVPGVALRGAQRLRRRWQRHRGRGGWRGRRGVLANPVQRGLRRLPRRVLRPPLLDLPRRRRRGSPVPRRFGRAAPLAPTAPHLG